jgi:protein-S-isoprenylcysteine O-methyltransferase Ste14
MAPVGEAERRHRAVLGTVVFTGIVPGTVVGLVPYLLSGWQLASSVGQRLLGVLLICAALPVFVAFLVHFVREGIGTPAPIAPPERLVVGGPFERVRNPGYVAVVALVIGQGLLFGSGAVLAYAVLLALGFHLFVVLYEEPTLRRRFGAEYEAYCRRVPRWWPRLSALLLVACALASTLACAGTKIETQWKDPAATAQDLAFLKVVAIAQVDDETTRRAAEDEMVRVLEARPKAQARGMRVVPSYTFIPAPGLGDVAGMRAKVEAAGFDGAVVLRLVADGERVTYVPGRYEASWGRVVSYDPGYTQVDRIVRVETSLYSVASGKRIWSGVSRTLNPTDLRDLVDEVARAVGAELAAQGLAP